MKNIDPYVVWDLFRIAVAIAFPIAVFLGPLWLSIPLGILLAVGLIESLIFRAEY